MKIYQVDAFTDTPFYGNPAGVCILERPAEENWMRAVAREMNLSETAFLHPEGDGYRLRWFTPAVEVKLCGHATLASAYMLYYLGLVEPDAPVHFHTLSGQLTATHRQGGWIALDFPAQMSHATEPPVALLRALGVHRPRYTGKNANNDFLVEMDSEETVQAIQPDFLRLGKVEGVRGVIATAHASTPGVDFVSRFFAPAVGVNEDPVTGSAHTALTPYWSAKLGKKDLVARQISARGGTLHVHDRGERVVIEGQAVLVLSGDMPV